MANIPAGHHVRCSRKGAGVDAILTAHIVRDADRRTLCGRDATKWTAEFQSFRPEHGDCKRCADRLSSLEASP